MTSVTKNLIILIVFIVWANTARAESMNFNEIFYRSLPASALINYSDVEKCIIKYWRLCEIG